MTKNCNFPIWTKIKWDGNPDLNLQCWRKTFGRGSVSVGIGPFLHIVYSYGANSDASLSSTRWRKDVAHLTEAQAMELVDANHGRHKT